MISRFVKDNKDCFKTKYGEFTQDEINKDCSSSSEEDEDEIPLTEDFEKDFFKTLAWLKQKDPRIYDNKIQFFNSTTENEILKSKSKEKKQEPLLLKDYEKKMLLKTSGKFEDEESDETDDDNDPRAQSPTYVEEQKHIKQNIKKALDDADENEDNWGGMFTKRLKTNEEHQKEENEYTKWLKGQKMELENKDVENDLKPLKEYWNDPKLDKDELFLRDYLLNKKYLEVENSNYVPTYEEVIHDSDDNLSEDEKNIENQEEFETKYNHRFEEPDQEFIKQYPRTMENSVRKMDDRRKLKRLEIKQRKQEEKKQKHEELKQLKTFKRKEVEDKIKKLKEITGNNDLGFQDKDFEEDFDPEVYDCRMQELFNDIYYQGEESDLKPEFADLSEELGPWANKNDHHCEDENFIMDCDYDQNVTKEETSRKKRIRFDKKGKKKESNEIDENNEKYQECIDELYKLDYEDMIGDLPCRFKYRQVVPNSFGLDIEEILVAKDRELNRWCSLKKTTQHRPEHVEKYEISAYKKKAENEALKRKILSSLYEELEEPKEDEYIQKVKNELNKLKEESVEENTEFYIPVKKKKKGNENSEVNKPENNINEKKLYEGIENKQKERKRHKKIKNSYEEELNDDTILDFEQENGNENENSESNFGSEKKKKLHDNNDLIGTNDIKITKKNDIVNKQKAHKCKNVDKIQNKQKDNETYVNNKQTSINPNVQSIKDDGKLSRRQKKNKKKLLTKQTEKPTEESNNLNKQKDKKRKRKHSEEIIPNKTVKYVTNKDTDKQLHLSNKRLEAYGFNPKKFKNKMKYKK